MATPLQVDIKAWNNSKKGPVQLSNFRKANPQLVQKMDEIQTALESTLDRPEGLSQDEFKLIVNDIVYREAREAQKRSKDEKARVEAEKNKMTLNRYIAIYTDQIKTGARQTESGRNFALSTVKTIRLALDQFTKFQKDVKRTYDFNDINMDFYYAYTAWLKKKKYSVNTVGKCVKELKTVMACAESEGHHTNHMWRDKKFKGTRIEVDSIYLTREDLDKIMAVDLSKYPAGYEQARDIFMIGVWTAQRVSDYNNIKKENFSTLTKNVMREEEDPNEPGNKIAWIEKQEITYVNIRQQKTGAKVSIPCNSQLKAILEKYDYQAPHLVDQVINRYIKEIAQAAGLTQLVEIETTKGGTPKKEKVEKYKLIHTHTARRTGATLMYLAGLDLYDIMKVTGHTSPKMLKKYIKADSLEVVEKLTDKYDYFK
ncbi:MAG: phage integrase SAM-like domain-containing protein [Bacteroidales bacterium]|nr:phage integrase SAM-like domain-containing protein [Bacteroidales bacterium]MBR0246266.1 phage integrase SAM-like domain-containing protein [Bacteroidales bacterium]